MSVAFLRYNLILGQTFMKLLDSVFTLSIFQCLYNIELISTHLKIGVRELIRLSLDVIMHIICCYRLILLLSHYLLELSIRIYCGWWNHILAGRLNWLLPRLKVLLLLLMLLWLHNVALLIWLFSNVLRETPLLLKVRVDVLYPTQVVSTLVVHWWRVVHLHLTNLLRLLRGLISSFLFNVNRTGEDIGLLYIVMFLARLLLLAIWGLPKFIRKL